MTDVLVEICVDSLAGLEAAVRGGADRIELCAALGVDGLTPTAGLLAAAVDVDVPVYAMIRPRPGDFAFSEDEVRQMTAEIATVRRAGLAGVVLGANQDDYTLDQAVLARLMAAAGPLGATLHRVIDLVPDPMAGLETAIDLGFERVLTSGQQTRATAGVEVIANMVARADGRIGVMAGCGVTGDNAADLVRATGVVEVHGAAAVVARSPVDDAMGFAGGDQRQTDWRLVRAMKDALA